MSGVFNIRAQSTGNAYMTGPMRSSPGSTDIVNTRYVLDRVTELTQYTNDEVGAHATKKDNPHSVTKAQVGLGAYPTSPADLGISTATQTALDGKVTANANITAGVYGKVSVDKKGLVTGGYDLEVGDIPNLAISKITGLQTALNGKTTESYVDTSIQSAIQNTWGGNY